MAQLRWMLEVLFGGLWMWLRTAGLTLAVVGALVFGYVEKPLGVALVIVGLTVFLLPALHKHLGVQQMMGVTADGSA
ncbi:MAG TPA: hypothetical protein DGT23_28165 [Micromonosporaceae bacterium]|nr:hypothetical protein [Micromonosporaceae bacterium]